MPNALINDVLQENIPYETGAMVLDLSKDRILRVNTRSGYRKIQAKAVILAMGCRERTREMIEIPGTPTGRYFYGRQCAEHGKSAKYQNW